jgi:hypothetical protein
LNSEAPGFVVLREEVWVAVFRRALAERVPLLIFTFNPEDSVPQRFVDDLFAEVAASGGEVIPVELTASEEAIEARIGSASRRLDGKVLDLGTYRQLRSRGAFEHPSIRSPRSEPGHGQPAAAGGRQADCRRRPVARRPAVLEPFRSSWTRPSFVHEVERPEDAGPNLVEKAWGRQLRHARRR